MNLDLYFEDRNGEIYKSFYCENCTCIKFNKIDKNKLLINEEIFDYEHSWIYGQYTNQGLSTFCKCSQKDDYIQVLEISKNNKESILWLGKNRVSKHSLECKICNSKDLEYTLDLNSNTDDYILNMKCLNCNHSQDFNIE